MTGVLRWRAWLAVLGWGSLGGAFVSGVGGGSGGGVLGRVFWGSGVEKGWDEALGGVGR